MKKHSTRPLLFVCAVSMLAACASTPKPAPTPAAPPTPPQAAQQEPPLSQQPTPMYRVPPMQFPPGTPTASRIVQISLREHGAWYQPFIDANGRLASRAQQLASNNSHHRLVCGISAAAKFEHESLHVLFEAHSNQALAFFGTDHAAHHCTPFAIDLMTTS